MYWHRSSLMFVAAFCVSLLWGLYGFGQPSREDQSMLLEKARTADLKTWETWHPTQEFTLSPVTGEGETEGNTSFAVAGVYPLPDSPVGEELVIFFNEPLAPLEEQGTAATLPLRMTPGMPGVVEVVGHYVRFRSAFLPLFAANSSINEIRVELHPELRALSGKRLPSSSLGLTLALAMPDVSPLLTETIASDDEGDSISPEYNAEETFSADYHYWSSQDIEGYTLVLSFSDAVNVDSVRENASIMPPVEGFLVEPGSWSGAVVFKGDFTSSKDYQLHLGANVASMNDQKRLRRDLTLALDTTPHSEGVVFDWPGLYYFPRRDGAMPTVKARNVTGTTVTLSQVFPSNLPAFVRDFEDRGVSTELMDAYARIIGKTSLSFPDRPDTVLSGEVDLSALLADNRRGVFLLDAEPAYSWRGGQRALLYTDLGVTAHWTDSEMALFVHDLYSLRPIEHASISVYSTKFQPMGAVHTDDEGLARFLSFDAGLGAPALVVVEKDDDYTFLDLRTPQKDTARFTASMPFYDSDGYDAYLYLDRSLYRPGETAHLRWIVRTNYVHALAEVPLQLRIANPQGRWIHEMPATLSSLGTGGFDFQTEQTHPTGKYTLELRVPGATAPLGMTSLNLEEFVPNRLRAHAAFSRERLLPATRATISVMAEHLFGGVAPGQQAEARIFYRPVAYESEAWPGYYFGNEDMPEQNLISLGRSVTDEQGLATFDFTFEAETSLTMPLEAVAGGRILEVGGRAVSDTARVLAFPDTVALGVAATPLPDRELLEVHVVAMNTEDDTPANIPRVEVTLERQMWDFHVRRFLHGDEPRWNKSFAQVATYEVALDDGVGRLEVPYPDYGEYRLRVHAPETRMYSAVMFNRWWERLDIVSASRPELIRLSLNQEQYQPGDRLELRIESPYEGRAFVVVQGEKIRETFTTELENGEGMLSLTVSHDWFPNVWLLATVTRNTDAPGGGRYPYSSYSMINVSLDAPEHGLRVAFLDAPEEMRPDLPLPLALQVHDHRGEPVANAEITVAAVDEGIHSILGYDNPDPYSHFQRARRFDMRRAHYYDKVFFDSDAPAIGGDMMRRLGIGSQVDENWIRPVALWSGAVTTDENGVAQVSFHVPEFIGQLRLVAVAVSESATGVSETSVYVRRPHVLRTSMPRFALAGDRFECTAVVMNLTDMPAKARIAWTASSALSGAGEASLDVPPMGRVVCAAPVRSAMKPGQGIIMWSMTVTDQNGVVLETMTEEALLPVRPPVACQTETAFITLSPGETRSVETTGFLEDAFLNTRIEVTADPLWRLRPGLRYLLQFPHGCVEQVVSKALPLFLVRGHGALYQDILQETGALATTADGYIVHTIERLLALQTVDGGMSAWPGSVTSYPYGSVYALHFLTLARRQHVFEVYEAAFTALQEYALGIMGNDRATTGSDYFLRAYAAYALALDGRIEALDCVTRLEGVSVPVSARHLLAGVKALFGDAPEDIRRYLDMAPVSEWSGRESSGTLHSPSRAQAVHLIAALHANAPLETAQLLANPLVQYLSAVTRFSTQEAGFAAAALAMFLEAFPVSLETAAVAITDKDGDHSITGGELFLRNVAGEVARYVIANTGDTPVSVSLETRGLPAQPRSVAVEQGFRMGRVFRATDGAEIDSLVFEHGQSYVVELRVQPEERVENLLITDLLPAGFEVVNPRLDVDGQQETAGASDRNATFIPAFLEVRDDRVALAVDALEAQEHVFRYLVQATTRGRFQLPALHAEGMYSPQVHAATAPGEIVIQ